MKFLTTIIFLCIASVLFAQKAAQPKTAKVVKNAPVIVSEISRLKQEGRWQFPITKMWDDAVAASKRTGKPAMVFNVDFVDSASISFRDKLLADPQVQIFLSKNFELAINDYAVDPPPSVGFDSLRNLGRRLDALEKGYAIAVRPTAIILRSDSIEIERIPLPNLLTPQQFITIAGEYLEGKNTVQSLRKAFWSDTNNLDIRKQYLSRLTARAEYDSVMYQLNVISKMTAHPAEAREATQQYAYLKMNVEGKTQYLKQWIVSLPKMGDDSLEALQGIHDLLEFYQSRKKADSLAVIYEQLFAYTGVRDPEVINNYAWDIATYSKEWDKALMLINEALAAKPANPDFYDTRAQIQYSLKKYSEAIEDEARAMKLAPKKEDKDFFLERLEYYKRELKKSQESDQSK